MVTHMLTFVLLMMHSNSGTILHHQYKDLMNFYIKLVIIA